MGEWVPEEGGLPGTVSRMWGGEEGGPAGSPCRALLRAGEDLGGSDKGTGVICSLMLPLHLE